MPKPPLSPSGIESLQDSLYALPDDLLLAEADAFEQDMSVWVRAHFSLNAHQEHFLDHHLSLPFVDYVEVRVSFAMRHRLPVHYTIEGSIPTLRDDDQGKILQGNDRTSADSGIPAAHVFSC